VNKTLAFISTTNAIVVSPVIKDNIQVGWQLSDGRICDGVCPVNPIDDFLDIATYPTLAAALAFIEAQP